MRKMLIVHGPQLRRILAKERSAEPVVKRLAIRVQRMSKKGQDLSPDWMSPEPGESRALKCRLEHLAGELPAVKGGSACSAVPKLSIPSPSHYQQRRRTRPA